MRKITHSERLVLERLLHVESFDTLLEETNMPRGALLDDLMNLLNIGYLEAYDILPSGHRKTRFCDTDNLEMYAYRATRTGLIALNA